MLANMGTVAEVGMNALGTVSWKYGFLAISWGFNLVPPPKLEL